MQFILRAADHLTAAPPDRDQDLINRGTAHLLRTVAAHWHPPSDDQHWTDQAAALDLARLILREPGPT